MNTNAKRIWKIVTGMGIFECTNREEPVWGDKNRTPNTVIELAMENIKITMTICTGNIAVSGTTEFFALGSWFTFDRRGIEQSFYSPYGVPIKNWDVKQTLLAQVERAKTAIAKRIAAGPAVATMFGFAFTAPRLEAIREELKTKGSVMLTPGGMGTAYKISKKRRSRFDTTLTKAQCELLGSAVPLYAEHIDWD